MGGEWGGLVDSGLPDVVLETNQYQLTTMVGTGRTRDVILGKERQYIARMSRNVVE
jgi:hypothetical protein